MPEGPKGKGEGAHAIDNFVLEKSPAKSAPKLCDDSTFLRRVYLDVIGLIPTLAQSEKFLAEQSPNKREKLIDELLAKNADYAAHWTPFWEDALGSGVVTGGLRARGNYQGYVQKAFEQNKPYDLFVLELINPRMSPGTAAPPKDYILTKNHAETLVSVSNASQVFL